MELQVHAVWNHNNLRGTYEIVALFYREEDALALVEELISLGHKAASTAKTTMEHAVDQLIEQRLYVVLNPIRNVLTDVGKECVNLLVNKFFDRSRGPKDPENFGKGKR